MLPEDNVVYLLLSYNHLYVSREFIEVAMQLLKIQVLRTLPMKAVDATKPT